VEFLFKKRSLGQAWGYMPIIPAPRRPSQEDHKVFFHFESGDSKFYHHKVSRVSRAALQRVECMGSGLRRGWVLRPDGHGVKKTQGQHWAWGSGWNTEEQGE
jgi:hypothetical protein